MNRERLNVLLTWAAVSLLAGVTVVALAQGHWIDAGFALAVGLHYVKELGAPFSDKP